MKCFNCNEEMNPTLLYCNHCGVPADTEPEDIIEDAEERARATAAYRAVADAKGLLVLGVFLFFCSVALRMVLLKDQQYDHYPAYRAPYTLVEEQASEPRVAVDVEVLAIPFPE